MVISLVGSTSGNSATAGITSFTSNVPGGVVTDDLLRWTWQGSPTATPTTPAGWQLLASAVTASSNTVIFQRWASAEPGSFASGTIATGRWAYAMHAYRGVDRSNPADAPDQVSAAGSSAYPFLPITPLSPGAWVIGTLGVVVAAGSVGVVTSSNMTVDTSTSSNNAGAANSVLGIGHLLVPTPATITPVYSVNQATVRSLRFTSALRPADFTGWGVAL